MSKITIDELRRAIETDEITTVVCAMPDLCGRMVGKRLTGRTFLETALGAEGLHGSLYLFTVSMEMWPQPGYEVTTFDTGLNDCLFLPDLDAIRITPWLERTAMVICDPCYEGTDTPLEVGPRNILKREIAKAARHGITAKFASELEFFLFQDSYEAAWDKGYRELDPTSRYNADYHILQSTKLEPIVRQIRDGMEAAGIEIEFSKTEWGLGQQEINLKYADTLEMADRHMLYKHGVKEIAALNGMSASFMAKLWKDEIGSSCHLHTSLWDTAGKTALCWDESRPGHISERFGHFLGGLLGTARELTALYAPNVNSYKRFEPLSMARSRLRWATTTGAAASACAASTGRSGSKIEFPAPTSIPIWGLPRRWPPAPTVWRTNCPCPKSIGATLMTTRPCPRWRRPSTRRLPSSTKARSPRRCWAMWRTGICLISRGSSRPRSTTRSSPTGSATAISSGSKAVKPAAALMKPLPKSMG